MPVFGPCYARHFPAIDWLQSYSLYSDRLRKYYDAKVAPDWSKLVGTTMEILQEEANLNEIVRLVGIDALGFKDRVTMECARSIREDFLHQNSFHEVDTYTSLEKQYDMLKLIITWYQKALDLSGKHIALDRIIDMPSGNRLAVPSIFLKVNGMRSLPSCSKIWIRPLPI